MPRTQSKERGQRLLITGLFMPAALAVIRRLGGQGWQITAADCHRLAYGLHSRFVRRRIHLPSLRRQPEAYAAAVLDELRSGQYDFYFPSYEEVILMSHVRDQVSDLAQTVLPPFETLIGLHDKVRLADLAARAGVPTPQLWVPRSPDEVRQLAAELTGPVAVKLRQGSATGGMRAVRDPTRLPEVHASLVRSYRLRGPSLPMVQAWVEGSTVCSLELCQDGRVVGQIMIRGVRTFPRNAGTTVIRECVSEPACAEASRKLVAAMNYTGFVGFDYVVDPTTGEPFVVDANPRIAPALNLAQLGGCDMVGAWVQIAQGKTVAPLPECPAGRRTRMHFADWVWLAESFARGFLHPWQEARQRRGWWRERRTPDDIASRHDPLPAAMLWLYVLTHLHRLVTTSYDAGELFIFFNRYDEHEPRELDRKR